jgi:hypothetical protein
MKIPIITIIVALFIPISAYVSYEMSEAMGLQNPLVFMLPIMGIFTVVTIFIGLLEIKINAQTTSKTP